MGKGQRAKVPKQRKEGAGRDERNCRCSRHSHLGDHTKRRQSENPETTSKIILPRSATRERLGEIDGGGPGHHSGKISGGGLTPQARGESHKGTPGTVEVERRATGRVLLSRGKSTKKRGDDRGGQSKLPAAWGNRIEDGVRQE